MRHRNSILGFIAAVSLTLREGHAAHAQGQGIARDAQIYAGGLFGDRLLETPHTATSHDASELNELTPGIVEGAGSS
jgi:hypothetical protein